MRVAGRKRAVRILRRSPWPGQPVRSAAPPDPRSGPTCCECCAAALSTPHCDRRFGLNFEPVDSENCPVAGPPPAALERRTMANPSDFDPRSFRLDDDDDDDHECDKHGAEKEGGGPNPFEKALLDARTLLLSGPVDDKMLKEATIRCLAMEQKDQKKPITVFINSPGGSADAGFAIYDLLRFVKPPVITVVNGLCASAGILIHLAAEKKRRFCMSESRFMIHQPSTMGRGTASDLDITAKEILKLRDRYNKIIAEQCNKTPEQVTESARRDFWLDAGQALEYGLVSKVVKKRDELPE